LRNEADVIRLYQRFLRNLSDTVVSKAPFGIKVKGLTEQEIFDGAVVLTDILKLAIEPTPREITEVNR
jgi:hypothetical protein